MTSTRKVIARFNRPRAYSTRKIAVIRPIGTEMIVVSAVMISVPKIA